VPTESTNISPKGIKTLEKLARSLSGIHSLNVGLARVIKNKLNKTKIMGAIRNSIERKYM
jgi:hypothetical protein